jgi:hypothetical protein
LATQARPRHADKKSSIIRGIFHEWRGHHETAVSLRIPGRHGAAVLKLLPGASSNVLRAQKLLPLERDSKAAKAAKGNGKATLYQRISAAFVPFAAFARYK